MRRLSGALQWASVREIRGEETHEVRTLPELFDRGVEQPREKHLLWRDADRQWRSLSTHELVEAVDHLSRGLHARGLVKGDRVALLSRNSPRWMMSDHAQQRAGLVTVPIYPTLTPAQVRYIVEDSGARWLLLEDRAQHERLRADLSGSALEGVALLSDEEAEGTTRWSDLVTEGAGAPDARPKIEPDDLATIIYTSGTTGQPKGVMLTHANLVTNAIASADAIGLAGMRHVNLSLLPLSHIFQRLVDYLLFKCHATMAYCPNPLEALEYMSEVRPTFFASVPRLYEKIHAGFRTKLAAAPPVRRALGQWALSVGRRRFRAWYRDGRCDGSPGPILRLQHAVADRLVLSKIRGIFGGRVDICFSGGAPIPVEVHEFFSTVGLPILPGYGLSESSPVISTNRRDRMRLGSVGPPIADVEVKIAADGEILARGPNIMKGYWNLPEETAATLVDGWLLTGDLGHVDELGFLFVTGRKKEILVLTTGKKVPPALVEDRMSRCPYVSQAVVVGDERKYVAALVSPNLEALAGAGRERGWAFSDPAELVGRREVKQLILESVAEACADLSGFERPKDIAFLPRELTLEAGELTPTLKLRRKVILEHWKALVDGLYHQGESRGAS